MVEVFEKCLVIGLSLMLAASIYPPILNIISRICDSVSYDQLNILAKEVDRLIKLSRASKGVYSLSYIVSKDFNMFFEGSVLKIFYGGRVAYVGVYDFDIIVDDLRKGGDFVRILVIGEDSSVVVVIEDAV